MLELIDGIYLGNAQPDSGGGSSPVIEELNVTPSTSSQTITAPSEIDGYSPVKVSAVTASIDQNIVASNIKKDVEILGVTGSYEGGGGSTITADNTTGSAISAGDKVWITPNGAGYDIVNLTKLQADFEVVGSPTIDYNTGIVSNMDNSNFIHVNKYLNSKNVELYIKIYPTSVPAGASFLKSAEKDYSGLYISNLDQSVRFYDGIRGIIINGNHPIPLNQWSWVYFKSTGGNRIECWTRGDNGYTLDTLPAVAEYTGWLRQFDDINYNGLGTDQYMFNIGNYEYGFFGSVDLKNTIIKTGPNSATIIETGVNYNGILWQPFEVVSNLGSTSFSGYATENIASGSSGQVSVILSE